MHHRLLLVATLHQAVSGCVSTLPDLQAALTSARPGDTVLLCDGDYEQWTVEVGIMMAMVMMVIMMMMMKVETDGVTVAPVTPGRVSLHLNSFVAIRGREDRLRTLEKHYKHL